MLRGMLTDSEIWICSSDKSICNGHLPNISDYRLGFPYFEDDVSVTPATSPDFIFGYKLLGNSGLIDYSQWLMETLLVAGLCLKTFPNDFCCLLWNP